MSLASRLATAVILADGTLAAILGAWCLTHRITHDVRYGLAQRHIKAALRERVTATLDHHGQHERTEPLPVGRWR